MKELSRTASAVKASTTLAIASMAKEMQMKGIDVVGFGTGEPDFATPENICRAAHAAIDAGKTKYTPAAGIPAPWRAAANCVVQRRASESWRLAAIGTVGKRVRPFCITPPKWRRILSPGFGSHSIVRVYQRNSSGLRSRPTPERALSIGNGTSIFPSHFSGRPGVLVTLVMA